MMVAPAGGAETAGVTEATETGVCEEEAGWETAGGTEAEAGCEGSPAGWETAGGTEAEEAGWETAGGTEAEEAGWLAGAEGWPAGLLGTGLTGTDEVLTMVELAGQSVTVASH